jgi:hypothetical protein
MHGMNRLLNILVITDEDVEAQNRVVLSALPPTSTAGGQGRVSSSASTAHAPCATASSSTTRPSNCCVESGARRVYRIG